MSKIEPLAVKLGAYSVDLKRRLEAAEGKAETLQHALNGTAVHLELCLDVMAIAVRRLKDGDGYCPAAALDLLRETLTDINGEEP
jgi:hypothetical protein